MMISTRRTTLRNGRSLVTITDVLSVTKCNANMSWHHRVNSGKLKQHIFKVHRTSKLFTKLPLKRSKELDVGAKRSYPVAENTEHFKICFSDIA